MVEDHQGVNQNEQEESRVLLIDLENCPDQISQLQEKLEQFSQVVICYAQTGAKIPLDWLIPLSATVISNKLKIFKMKNGGKNAADFGISFFAGALMQQLPEKTHFVIISNDTDLDHVVNLLRGQGRSAERMSNKIEETKTTTATKATVESTLLTSQVRSYCKNLVTYQRNRPASKDTLLSDIKNKFKGAPDSPVEIFRILVAKGVIILSGNKVSYDDKRINELAN